MKARWRIKFLALAVAASVGQLVSPAPANSAEFHNQTLQDGIEAILIIGDIVEGDEETFRQLSISFPDAIIGLDSEGGQLVPALEIGRLIRLRGYQTAVLGTDTCASACALVWMAGNKKTLANKARLGFHASYLDRNGRLVESGAANALVGRYLTQLNYSEDTVLFATLAPPEDIWWLNERTKDIAGIDFEIYYSDPEPAPPPIRTTRIPPPSSPTATIRSLLQRDGVAANAAASLGATGPLHSALTDHLQRLYNEEVFVSRVEDELNAARIDIGSNPSAGGAVIFRLSTKLMLNGMSRLPQRDVNNFFLYYSAVSQAEGNRCDVTLGTSSSVNLNEFRYIQALGGSKLDDYLALLRKAIIAEANEFPARVELEKDQITVAEAAWAEVLIEAMDRAGWSEDRAQSALLAIERPTAENTIERCAMLKLILPTVAEMDGMVGDWFRRVYLTYVQESL